ncbi:MAG: ATP-binding protein [Methanoregula sp.]|nr:ATP-binding protein [Methanoregula sp.]
MIIAFEKEEHLKNFIDTLQIGILIIDAETHTIVYANPMALSIIRAPEDKVLGQICHKFVCPSEKGKCPVTDFNLPVVNAERVLLNVRGERIPIIKSVKSMTIEGKRLLIESFVDISDRKRMENFNAQLIHELENANNELKDFAYITSHDLKAPLRAIGSLSQWLYTDYNDKFDEEGKVQLDLLVNRVNRMQNLIEGILEYSRVGRTREENETINLNMLIQEIIDSLSPPQNISVVIDTPLPTIYFDKTRIRQVFANLIGNAIKYMDKPQGEIHIGCMQDENNWKFSVKDNGQGIDKKYYDRVFQIFQTLHARDEVESTGIGLTIVKKIIEMYGGKIWIESELGTGSTFYFTIHEEKETIDPNMFIREIIDSLSPPSHISIVLDTSFPMVHSDKIRIRQVFSHLIGNAIKYMDKPQGEIHIGCIQNGNNWKFFVNDNGPGMDE